MGLPQNIIELAEKNEALLDRIGFKGGIDDPYDLCNPEAYLRTGLFTHQQVVDLFEFSDPSIRKEPLQIPKNIGMVLVRPDMLHMTPVFEDFIRERFRIVASENVIMTGGAYWEIYSHDLYRLATMHSRLTRAAMYMGSTCRLIVFTGDDDRRTPLSNEFVTVYKGMQGSRRANTLRGDIVYHEGLRLGLHTAKVGTLQSATDPFMAYRRLATEEDGPHTSADYPLLFYTGVGVHIPNGEEISTDLLALAPELARELAKQL